MGDPVFAPFTDAVEQEMLPLFEFMRDPEQIDYDEAIVLFLGIMIRHNQRVTPIEWQVLPHLINFYRKYRTTFGFLLRLYS